MTRVLPNARPFGLPVYVALLPADSILVANVALFFLLHSSLLLHAASEHPHWPNDWALSQAALARRAMTAWPPYVFPYLTCQAVRRQPKTRAGRNKMDLSRAKTASKVIPIKRNGIERSQTKGKSTRTRSASGHETTRSRDQTRKAINVFTPLAFHSRSKRQPGAKR